jgi:hypothetical protein
MEEEVVLEHKDADDWVYRGEGAANLVLAYTGSSPFFVCSFLIRIFSDSFPFFETFSINLNNLYIYIGVVCIGRESNADTESGEKWDGARAESDGIEHARTASMERHRRHRFVS